VWNGLDANAKRIDINIEENGLGGVESIQIIDNGDGIDFPNILDNFDRFNESLKNLDNLLQKFAIEFGWYLALNKEREIYFNSGQFKVVVPDHDFSEVDVPIEQATFKLTFLRWHDKPSSEQPYYYLLNSSDRTVYKQHSSFNKENS
jgi:hypothetical protein